MAVNFTDYATKDNWVDILGNNMYHVLSCWWDNDIEKFYYKVEAAFLDEEVARNAFGRYYAKKNYILVFRNHYVIHFINQDKIEAYER